MDIVCNVTPQQRICVKDAPGVDYFISQMQDAVKVEGLLVTARSPPSLNLLAV